MAADIEQVADRAGVSTATVSRAMRGLPNVSESTRGRVLAAARELGYVASPSASTLAGGRSRTVALVAPFVTRWFFGQAVNGAERVLRDNGYDVLLYNVPDAGVRQRFFDQMPLRKRADAVVLICLPPSAEEAAALRALDIPVALIGVASEDFPTVRIDDVEGAERAVQHLVNLGHERIGLVAGDEDLPVRFTVPIPRRDGYRQVLERAGIELDPQLEVPGHFTVGGGAHAMAELLSRPRPPTAVFAESDEMALGAIRTARRLGLRVPQDLSVIGFDDHEMADMLDLTTVAQPVSEQGVLAATLVLDAVERGNDCPPDMILPTRLVVRATTAPPSRSRFAAPDGGG